MTNSPQSEKIFLHYTKAELDRNFDQRGWITNAEELIVRYQARSRAARADFAHVPNIPYGPTADEVLDLFPVANADAPVQIFVHGGAWRNFSKDDYSFPAATLVPAGIHTVVLNFANLPEVSLQEMITQVRRGIDWTCRNAKSFKGDANAIFVSAQSSGAHLAMMALTRDWTGEGLPNDLVRGAVCISGPYDLEPVMLSARSSYVKVAKEDERALSPVYNADRIGPRVFLAYAEHDTYEFQRQSRAFGAALERAGRLAGIRQIPGLNHFELIETLGIPGSALADLVLAQSEVATMA
jgi:arylformamidase